MKLISRSPRSQLPGKRFGRNRNVSGGVVNIIITAHAQKEEVYNFGLGIHLAFMNIFIEVIIGLAGSRAMVRGQGHCQDVHATYRQW